MQQIFWLSLKAAMFLSNFNVFKPISSLATAYVYRFIVNLSEERVKLKEIL